MAWAKYGDLEVTYTLGDADPYDKFVVHVNLTRGSARQSFKPLVARPSVRVKRTQYGENRV